MSLIQALQDPQTRREIVADAARVLDAEVADKGGMSGMVVKASFKMVRVQVNTVFYYLNVLNLYFLLFFFKM